MRKHVLAVAIAALSLSGVAVAHEAGDVVLRVGVIHASPNVDSSKIKLDGTKLAGTSADVGSDTQLGLTATYMVMPHFGLELLAATPFTHDVKVKGLTTYGFSDGKFGKVSHLPPTLSAQFFFLNPKSKFQPYVGLGLTYTAFFSEKLTSERKAEGFSNLKLDNSIGISPQIGMDFKMTDSMIINASVWRLGISTTAKADHALGKVKVDVDINPWVYFVGLGYKF
jgi:outer membrane protein